MNKITKRLLGLVAVLALLVSIVAVLGFSGRALAEGNEAMAQPAAEEPAASTELDEPAADEPAVDELAADEPAATELAAEEPAVEPAASEPAGDEPATTEPAAADPAATEPAANEAVADEPAAASRAVTESEATEPETTEPKATKSAVDKQSAAQSEELVAETISSELATASSYELSFAFVNLYPGAQPQTLLKSLTVNGEDWTPTSGNITAKDIPAGSSVTATVKVTDDASLASYNNPGNTIADLVPKYSDNFSEVTFTFTMPETDARIVVYLFEAVTVTYDANGGVKQSAWTDSVKWRKYNANLPVTIHVSQELYDAYSDKPRVLPAEGYKFDGIEVTQNKTGAKVTGKPGETITVDFSEGGTIKFLWEKLPTLTLHASSVEGDDFVDPIVIPVEKGTTIAQALEHYKSGTSLVTELFQVDGYKDYGYRTPKPMSEYSSNGELWDNNVSGSDTIEADLDIYYSMVKLIDSVEVTYTPPVCGTETTTPSEERPWGTSWTWEEQTNPPATSLPGGVNYELDTTEGGTDWSFWIADMEDWDAFVGTFEGGKQYLAETWLHAKYGYAFSEDAVATVNGGTLLITDYDGGYLGVYADVTAEHDWSEWTETTAPTCTEPGEEIRECKNNGQDWHTADASETREVAALGHDWGEWEVTKPATTTEEGEETRVCKRCGEKETRAIPKLDPIVYTNTAGDGNVWTKGSNVTSDFTFKRSTEDETTFSHFVKAQVDGEDIPAEGYVWESGSVIVRLNPSYLETLALGEHTLTAIFDDGNSVDATFTVVEEKTYTLTVKLNGGTLGGSTDDIVVEFAGGTVLSFTGEIPTRAGYTFAGWKDSSGKLYQVSDTYTVLADDTLTAQWTANAKPAPAPAPKPAAKPAATPKTGDLVAYGTIAVLAAGGLASLAASKATRKED